MLLAVVPILPKPTYLEVANFAELTACLSFGRREPAFSKSLELYRIYATKEFYQRKYPDEAGPKGLGELGIDPSPRWSQHRVPSSNTSPPQVGSRRESNPELVLPKHGCCR